uniref:Endophilin-B1 n=1 Tax=Cyprinus carpio TaxID=7962 RepID=A0A8C1IHX7_CYPCA
MDFNVKRLAADAGTLFSRAVQFTEEKFGQAEKTELDAHFENLLTRAETTKHWTEKILKQTEVLLQPNPNVRIEEFLYEKLDKKVPTRMNNHELLGQSMIDSGNEFGPGTAYGNALIKCGETEKQIGGAERELIQSSAINFLTPFRNFLEGDFKTILKERKLLQNKRLDLDAAKTKLKKAKMADARLFLFKTCQQYLFENALALFPLNSVRPFMCTSCDEPSLTVSLSLSLSLSQAEQDLKMTQSEFDRQAEITRLLLEGINSTHAHHLHCLNDFVEAQMTYYAQCYQYMVDLQKQLGNFPSAFSSNNNQSTASGAASISVPILPLSGPLPANTANASSGFTELQNFSGSRKARVLYDYDAAGSNELSLLADEVIMVSSVPGMDSDWLMGERGNQKGKVPITYLELLN